MSGDSLRKNVIKQVWQQCNAVGSKHPLIWMPLSKKQEFFKHQKGVTVVNGSQATLIRALQSLDLNTAQHYIIRFDSIPKESTRNMLKHIGMKYNGSEWKGHLSKSKLSNIILNVEKDRGSILQK